MKGRLFIISAPSGAGKSTLCNKLRAHYPDIQYSISYTTRPPRNNECNGVDYNFISCDDFKKGIQDNQWAEWACVHDNYYGTSRELIESYLDTGKDVLLEIDVQGMQQIVDKFPDAITIFIKPPSLEVLKSRLERRGTDAPDVIEKRLLNAKKELSYDHLYQHHIVNDNLKTAAQKLISLFS
ncbi:MAG: Guanylate kinase [Candidatus Magnetoglobus multicellularis str. Araruama]|uniref:Guanylate kinase n=1 Tax=Candidatus Magnetoglobus multicellularis str. Araruama TaxID=890399 RepID=A0A1V1PFT4_9BACT|nr:MAG: Guanylate kinase [Candidatus Magnetoglobus multicellularis str. Araruama]